MVSDSMGDRINKYEMMDNGRKALPGIPPTRITAMSHQTEPKITIPKSKITKERWKELLAIQKHLANGNIRGASRFSMSMEEFQHLKLWSEEKRKNIEYTPTEETGG